MEVAFKSVVCVCLYVGLLMTKDFVLHDNIKVLANQGLAQVVVPATTHAAHEAGHFSDTTASAAGSDDEGSTAATDGSTLRTSPAEQVLIINYLFRILHCMVICCFVFGF